MNELALFAGAGGGILGGHLLGWRTVAAVEIEDYPRRVLLQRQADGILPRFPIWDDVRTFDGKPWLGKIDVVTGGFPCQDISAAGKGAGIEGEKSGLWKEMARIIGEVRPRFAFMENSPLLVGRGITTVLSDLAQMGYDAKWGVLGADDCGAPHRRKRIWICATDAKSPRTGIDERGVRGLLERCGTWKEGLESENVAHADGVGSLKNPELRELRPNWTFQPSPHRGAPDAPETFQGPEGGGWWENDPAELADSSGVYAQGFDHGQGQKQFRRESGRAVEPRMGRVAHGVAHRVDRLKAIGNGQVPIVDAVAYEILKEDGN